MKLSEKRFSTIFHKNSVPLALTDFETGRFLEVNDALLKMMRAIATSQLLSRTTIEIGMLTQEQRLNIIESVRAYGGVKGQEAYMKRLNGERFAAESTLSSYDLDGTPCLLTCLIDISERKKLENQLRHAQKMESVGRLAGGVAHDFNNMLSVILGYVEMSLEELDSSHPLHQNLVEIQNAAERSAGLIRQLLAFSRQQTIAPKTLNLNDAIEKLLKMLHRLIGENIDLAWLPEKDLWPVKMDPVQVDQILANLCVNARDSISGNGKITIETHNFIFDTVYCEDHANVSPGAYVMLAVSDNGCGMDKETMDQIFDPFFSTKKLGRGTGLGLSTVYGIVKQNNGHINVYSEPGKGSIFRIYIGRSSAEEKVVDTKPVPTAFQRGSETILFVEDEIRLMEMGKRMLETLGYRVLSTTSPIEALTGKI